MNKILNWTFGACFRTLGRFLAIFLVGLLLIFIGSKIGIELPSWLALNVNASTVWSEDWAQLLPTLTRVDYNDCSTTSNYGNGRPYCTKAMEMDYNELTTGIGTRPFVSTTTSMSIGTNGYVISVPTQKVKPGYLYNVNFYVCSNKSLASATHDINMGQMATKNNYNIYAQTTSSNLPSKPGLEGTISFNYCSKASALIVPDMDSVFLNYRLTSTSVITGVYISTIAVEVNEMGIYTSTLEEVINNSGFATSESVEQVQESVNQVQQEIQQTQDTITNEDTTGAEDSASGFFNDFTTETFGLTSIITAPLNAINSLISSTCSPLVLPLPYVDKNLSLPCMSVIYNQYFGAFFSIYQLITTGLISYYVIVRIFNLVKDFKNPDHDEIEVVDL